MSKTIDGKYIFTHKGDDYVHLKDYVKLLNKIDKAIEYMEMELGTNREGVFKAFGDLDYAQEEVENLYRILKGEE